MKLKYSFQNMEKGHVPASGRDLGISTKKSVEICKFLKGKSVEKAKIFLKRVVDMTSAVPMTHYNTDTGHKPGIGPGRYPIKAAKAILIVLESAEANAKNKGMNPKDLMIIHMAAHRAARPWHFGRKKRQKMKRTHIEVVLAEVKDNDAKKTKGKKAESKDAKVDTKIKENKKAEN
jgi:large subunit ribosomal protein L22